MNDNTKPLRRPSAVFWRRLASHAVLGGAGAVGSGVVSVLLCWLRNG
ncbi:hypothetical protein [Streptomyces sp. NPDC005953]